MLSQQAFDDILSDAGKRIDGDIVWTADTGHYGAMRFRAAVLSAAGHPLFVAGWYRPQSSSLTYTVVHREVGRIYAINFGHPHTNPLTNESMGMKHKHYWTEAHGDAASYIPDDITEPWYSPVAVWRQFCLEFRIEHRGIMILPEV